MKALGFIFAFFLWTYCIIVVDAAAFTWVPGNNKWEAGLSWVQPGFPGNAKGTVDDATIAGAGTVTLGESLKEPANAVVSGPTLKLNSNNAELDSVTVNTGGTLQVSKSAKVKQLTLNAKLDLSDELEITVGGTLGANGAFVGGTGTLTVDDGVTLKANSNFVISKNTLKLAGANAKLQINGPASMTGGSITGSGKLNVVSGGTFTVSGGNVKADISLAGVLNVKTSIGDGNDDVTSTANGKFVVDSTSGGINIDYNTYDLPAVEIKCVNTVTFSNSVDTAKLTITGSDGCKVNMDLININDAVSVTDANLVLPQAKNAIITEVVDIYGKGAFEPNTGEYTLQKDFTLHHNSNFEGKTPRFALTSNLGSLNFKSDQTVSAALSTGSQSGTLNVENSKAIVTLTGSNTLANSVKWSFKSCSSVTMSHPWNVNAAVDQFCPLTVTKAVVLSSALTIKSNLVIGGSNGALSTQTGATIDCKSGGTIAVQSGRTFDSRQSFLMNACTFNTNGNTVLKNAPVWSGSVFNIDGGTTDIRGADITLNTNSKFDWNSGSLTTNSNTKMTFEGSLLHVDQAGTMEGTYQFDSTSRIQNTATLDFRQGSVAVNGGFLDVDAEIDFSSTVSPLKIDATVTHTTGLFDIDASATLGGDWTSTGGSHSWDGSITILDDTTMNLNSDFVADNSLVVNAGANVKITHRSTESILDQKSDVTVTGTDAVLEFTRVRVKGSIKASSGGLVSLGSWPNGGLTAKSLKAESSGTIAFGSGSFGKEFTGDKGIMKILPSETLSCNGCTVLLNDDSDLVVDNGARFNFYTGTITSTKNGKIKVNSGATFETYADDSDFELNDKLNMTGQGRVILGGVVDLKKTGSITLSGANSLLHIRSSAEIQIIDNFKISLADGTFNVYQDIEFEDNSILEVNGLKTFYFDEKIVFTDDSDFLVTGGTVSGDGDLKFEKKSSWLITGTNTKYIQPRYDPIEMKNDAKLTVNNGAKLELNDEVQVKDKSEIRFLSNSEILLKNDGDIELNDKNTFINLVDSHLILHDGEMDMFKGYFLLEGDSTVTRLNDDSDGTIDLWPGSVTEVVAPCKVRVQPPIWNRFGGTVISTGNFTFSGAKQSYGGPGCDIYQGPFDNTVTFESSSDVVIENEGCIIIIDSTLVIDDSSFLIKDIGRLELDNSKVELTGTSSFDTENSGEVWLHTGSEFSIQAPVTFGNAFNISRPEHLQIKIDQSSWTVSADVQFLSETVGILANSSSFTLQSGNLTISNDAQLDVELSSLNVAAGNLIFKSPNGINVQESMVDISGSLIGESVGVASFFGSTFTSAGGSIQLIQSSSAEFTDLTTATISSDLVQLDSSSLKVQNATVMMSGNVDISTSAYVLVDNQGNFTIGGSVVNINGVDSNARIEVINNSDMRIDNSATMTISGDAGLRVDNSDLQFDSGVITFANTADMTLTAGAIFNVASANIIGKDTSVMSLSAASMTLGGGSSFSVQNGASLLLNNNSVANIDGSVTTENTALIHLTGSLSTLSGSLDMFGSSAYKLNTSITNLSGDVILNDDSDLLIQAASAFNMIGSGKMAMNNITKIDVSASILNINAEALSMNGQSSVLVRNNGSMLVNDGFLFMNDQSNVQVTFGRIHVLLDDMYVRDNSTLQLTGVNSALKLNGGNVYLSDNSKTTLASLSQFQLLDGSLVCDQAATIKLTGASTLASSGSSASSTFSNMCGVTVQTASSFTFTGPTTFEDSASYTLNNAAFNVMGGTTIFRDNADGTIANTGSFIIDGGDASFEDDADLDISVSSTFKVANGNLNQQGTSDISISQTGTLSVLGSVTQFGDATISLSSNSKLTVNGTTASFVSNDNTRVSVSASSTIQVISGDVELYDTAEWNITSSSLQLQSGASYTQSNDTITTISKSSYSVDGSVLLNDNSFMDADSVLFTISNGGYTAKDTADLAIASDSSFIVDNGLVTFCDDATFSMDGSSVLVVNAGSVTFKDRASLNADPNSSIDVLGDFYILNNVCPTWDTVDVTVSGLFHLRNQTCLTVLNSEILIDSNGEFGTFDDHQLTVVDSELDINVGSVLFSGTTTSFVDFTNVNLTLSSGNFEVRQFASFSIDSGDVDIQDGEAIFTDNTVSSWVDSTLQIHIVDNDPALLAFLQNSDNDFLRTNVQLIGGNVNFGGSALVDMVDSSFHVASGKVTMRSVADASFLNTPLSVDFGEFKLFDNSTLLLQDSSLNMNSLGGDFTAEDFACVTLLNSPVSIFGGSVDFNENACMTATDSPILVDSGSVVFSHSTSLALTTPLSTLTIEDGNFILENMAEFTTVRGTQIYVNGGNFLVSDGVVINFDTVSMFVGGNVAFSNATELHLIDSTISIDQGVFTTVNDVVMSVTSSTVTVDGGSFSTTNNVDLSFIGSQLLVAGDVVLDGSISSSHNFVNSFLEVNTGGDLLISGNAHVMLDNTQGNVNGGFFEVIESAQYTATDGSSLVLDGDGSVVVRNNGHITIEDDSVLQVITNGATASFFDNAVLDVYTASTFNVTNGDVRFYHDSAVNLWEGTYFNVLGGSFTLSGSSNLIAYPATSGTIEAGNFNIYDDACVTFIESNIRIEGALTGNSTCPVNFLSNSTIIIDGAPVTISGTSTLFITGDTFLHVIDGSIILHDSACIFVNNTGRVLVSGGSILAYDYTCIVVSHDSSFDVTGGNVTMYDFSTFRVVNNSVLTVATNGTVGSVYVYDEAYMEIRRGSELLVIGGNLEVANHAHFLSQTDALVRIVDGDVLVNDYAIFDVLSGTTFEILDGGNFEAAGAGVELNFDRSDTRIVGGDFVSSVRVGLFASEATFEISNNGNVLLTDISRSFFSEQTTLSIFGGGNLELYRSANLFLDSSSVTINDAGSVIANSDASLELVIDSTISVNAGGSIIFSDDSVLIALSNSVARVDGGGNILFEDASATLIKGESEFTVTGSGSIIFRGTSNAEVVDSSQLFVDDGGNISFEAGSYLRASESLLSVQGGGSILFNGNGISNVEDSSVLSVAGGNIENYDSRVVNMIDSSLAITAGDLRTFGSSEFNMIRSSGVVSGGNFILRDSSLLNMEPTSALDISGGNVELYNNGVVAMDSASMSVTNSVNTGSFAVNDFVSVTLSSSTISVAGGNFATLGSSTVDTSDSSISVSSGSMSSSGSSTVRVSQGSISVSGGSLTLSSSSKWQVVDNSQTTVSGGDVLFEGSSFMNIADSSLDITNGDFSVDDSARLDMTTGSLTVAGGDVLFAGSAIYNGQFSQIAVTCGQIIYDNNAQFVAATTSILINRQSCSNIAAKLPNPISLDDLIVVGGSSVFRSSAQSTIDIVEGNFVFVESASSVISNAIINIAGGNLNMIGNTRNDVSASTITLSSGSFQLSESAQATLSENTLLSVTGGNLIASGSVVFSLQSSTIQVHGGLASFIGGHVEFIESVVDIRDNGSLRFGGSSVVEITGSSVSMSGSGVFEIIDNTNMNVVASVLTVSEGSFTVSGNSEFSVVSSTYTITGGDTTYAGNSHIIIDSSTFSVLGGNVIFTDNVQFTIRGNTLYEIDGGNVITQDSSVLNLDGSCFVIRQGSVEYNDNNVLRLTNHACWNVTGGDVFLNDNVEYSLNSNSALHIAEGSFVGQNSVIINVDHSKVNISGGNFQLNDQSSFTLTNGASVIVSKGDATFAGSIIASVRDSSFDVSGGYVEFSGAANLDWRSSSLSVTAGNMLVKGSSVVSFVDSVVLVSGGGLRFEDSTDVTIDSSNFEIFIGSVNFVGNSVVSVTDTAVSIKEGDLQFSDESSVTFTNSPIQLEGQLEFLGNANTHFFDSDLTIISGSFHAKDHSNVFFERCNVDIGGSLHAQSFADIKVEDSRISVDNGDVRINDQGSFNMHRSSLVIESGNFVANNPSTERKYLTFTNSVISVERTNGNALNGHMELHDNIEMSLLSTDVVVDGNLVLTGSARMNIFEESSFHIPTGIVEMEESSSIIIDGGSSLLNQGQLVAPGSLRVPGDSSMSNEGILESDHDLNANCFADLTNGAPLVNSGIFRLGSADSSHPLQSCVDQLQHSGLMQLGSANMTFNIVQTTRDSSITLAGSTVSMSSDDPFLSDGSLGGNGVFTGSLVNNGEASIMANGETGATLLTVERDFSSAGTMFFTINSRDLSSPGAITQVNAGRGVALNGGRACVCINPSLELEEGDRFDLVNAQTALTGRFDKVEFDCVECPRRNAKSVESTSASVCEPSADYGTGVSFSVLLGSCGDDSGSYFDRISPPWYVVFPVAVGIIAIIVVVFGGALFIDEHIRKKKFKKKMARKRSARVKKFVDQNRARSTTMSASSSSMM